MIHEIIVYQPPLIKQNDNEWLLSSIHKNNMYMNGVKKWYYSFQ